MKNEGNCWLCGQVGPLTREHIPPRSAFNDHEILLQAVDERSRDVGSVIWKDEIVSGLVVRSLCAKCNNEGGRKYGSHYAQFINDVAEQVDRAREGETITIPVNRPLSILKQIIQNFVSANGSSFVKTHPWIRKFLGSSRNKDFPHDLYVYAFAVTGKAGRKTGVGGFYDLVQNRICVVAEFTFWPLGTVLAFQPMDQYRLAAVHHFANYDYTVSNAKLLLNLPVNPAASAYPVDFRSRDAILNQRQQTESRVATEDQGREMMARVLKQAGEDEEHDFIFSGHPKVFPKHRST